jgi:hypothetical protein
MIALRCGLLGSWNDRSGGVAAATTALAWNTQQFKTGGEATRPSNGRGDTDKDPQLRERRHIAKSYEKQVRGWYFSREHNQLSA